MKLTAYTLILASLGWITLRLLANPRDAQSFTPEVQYHVTYRFTLDGEDDPYRIRSFVPIDNQRQQIRPSNDSGDIYFESGNKRILWSGLAEGADTITYSFAFSGKPISYEIQEQDDSRSYFQSSQDVQPYLRETEYIQLSDLRIQRLANKYQSESKSLTEAIENSFAFVYAIPPSASSEFTSASETLDRFEASCNGKSRLLTAILRAQDIPARMVGGIILEETKKKTSHAWVEAYIGGTWIPFDALNGHFASLPANYMEIYKGDEFLITRSPNIDFDYMYHIEQQRVNHYPTFAMFDLWTVVDSGEIPFKQLSLLLLLPLGALIVAISKNVIGLKTFGVFLPVLIAFSLAEMGILMGLAFFCTVIILISLVNIPLDRWGLLQTPKVVVMLTVVVLYCLAVMALFLKTGWTKPASALLFPIIILTITSERFARKVEEEDLMAAITIFAQTLVVTLICYFVVASNVITDFVITFPEFLITISGINLLLGKWIGLRVSEYFRFKINDKSYHYV